MNSAVIQDAANYLRRSIGSDGRFRYIVDAATGKPKTGGYNLARHAGTVAALINTSGMSPQAEAALKYLVSRSKVSGSGTTAVFGKGNISKLGTNALTVLALAAAVQRGQRQYLPLLKSTADHLRAQMRPDGTFVHNMARGDAQLPADCAYYPGEAALAMLIAGRVLGDGSYRDDTRRALRTLAIAEKPKDFADHWLNIAADELDAEGVHDPLIIGSAIKAAVDVANQINAKPQIDAWNDLSRRTCRAAVRLEALGSAINMAARHGQHNAAMQRAADMLASMLMDERVNKGPAAGAFRDGPDLGTVRIDTVQHAMNALMHARSP